MPLLASQLGVWFFDDKLGALCMQWLQDKVAAELKKKDTKPKKPTIKSYLRESCWRGRSESSSSAHTSLDDEVNFQSSIFPQYFGGDSSDDELLAIDFSSHFTTNETFPSMEGLREWVQKVGFSLFMVITTKSSKPKKIIFHCERSGLHRSGKKKKLVDGKKVRPKRVNKTRSKKKDCPFLLHGIFREGNASRVPGWTLSVVRARHNHLLSTTLIGHAFASRLTKEQRRKVIIDTAAGARPKVISTQIMNEYTGSTISRRQVYTVRAKKRLKSLGNLNVTQWSLGFLKDKGYLLDTDTKMRADGKEVLTCLFVSHPDARHLLRLFPNVIIMDSTYKINRYGMPLFQIIGFTCTNFKYCIALAFMERETASHYAWALTRLKWLFGGKGPVCIMSDRELGLIKAVDKVFPKVRHHLCQVHVDRNVKAYAKLMKIDEKKFSGSVRRVMRSHTKEEYEERLAHFRDTWNEGLVRYVEDTWFTTYKEKLVAAWCDDVLHFATRTSNRVEGQHSILKAMIETPVGRFDTIVQHIDNMFVDQHRKIRFEMTKNCTAFPMEIVNGPEWVKVFFKCIFEKCSEKCLRMLYAQAVLAKEGKIGGKCDDFWWKSTLGLPCPHTIKVYLETGYPLVPEEVDIFWKQIRWEGVDVKDFDADDSVAIIADNVMMQDFFEEFFCGKVDRLRLKKMAEKWREIDDPTSCQIEDPPCGETKKGRPRMNARKIGTKRNMSWDEHMDVKNKKMKEEQEKDMEEELEVEEEDEATEEETTKVKSSVGSKLSVGSKGCPSSGRSRSGVSTTKASATKPAKSRSASNKSKSASNKSLKYLGFNWGRENIDLFMLAYISSVQSVKGDGHCGYRSLAVLLGRREEDYIDIRLELSKHLQTHRSNYLALVGEDEMTVEVLIRKLNYITSPCTRNFWCMMPIIGLVFATKHQVAVVVLSWFGPHTCLPLWAPPGAEPPTKVYAVAHLDKRDHYVPIWLVDDRCPIPPPPRQWFTYKYASVDGWDSHERFKDRFKNYVEERVEQGRPDILT